MTVVPLPDTPCLRVQLVYQFTNLGKGGNRFYLKYSGSAASGTDLNTLATDISNAWSTDIKPLMDIDTVLKEVDVLDIATDHGLSGFWTGPITGTNTGTVIPIQASGIVEYDIARRYRGGKPRIYWPPGVQENMQDQAHWTSGYQGDLQTGTAAFFAAIEALSVGALGTLGHVNLSYYKGFHNVTNSSGRERAVPTYRATALHDDVGGYAAKLEIGSQKRRRTSVTP